MGPNLLSSFEDGVAASHVYALTVCRYFSRSKLGSSGFEMTTIGLVLPVSPLSPVITKDIHNVPPEPDCG